MIECDLEIFPLIKVHFSLGIVSTDVTAVFPPCFISSINGWKKIPSEIKPACDYATQNANEQNMAGLVCYTRHKAFDNSPEFNRKTSRLPCSSLQLQAEKMDACKLQRTVCTQDLTIGISVLLSLCIVLCIYSAWKNNRYQSKEIIICATKCVFSCPLCAILKPV